MQSTIPDLAVWLIVGLLAGSLAGFVMKRSKKGYGHFINLGLGLVGALIGGFLFDLLRIDLGLANIFWVKKDLTREVALGHGIKIAQREFTYTT